jgi:hypothetical protein
VGGIGPESQPDFYLVECCLQIALVKFITKNGFPYLSPHLPSEMLIVSIRRFNPFNLQHGPAIGSHARIQEIIFYAESRFRSIAFSLTTAGHLWTQKLLQAELVSLS